MKFRALSRTILAAAIAGCMTCWTQCNAGENANSGAPLPATSDFKAPAEVEQFSVFEISMKLDSSYENPFDRDEVAVDAVFTSPSGKTSYVQGFYSQDYERSLEGKKETLKAIGSPCFMVRFCPSEAGTYSYCVDISGRKGSIKGKPMTFKSVPSSSKGFIRLASNRHYFRFDDGSTYFPVGENLCWANSSFEYDDYLSKLQPNGVNYIRLWLEGPARLFMLERTPKSASEAAGTGRYDLESAWRLDHVLKDAQSKGICAMICIEAHCSLLVQKSKHPVTWDEYPYNAQLGGPCAKQEDFFTDATAKKLFKRRLDYIVARYGAMANVQSWELFNEVNNVNNYNKENVRAWHREMGQYLKGRDPYGHLVTTNYGPIDLDPVVNAMPEMDFIQSHNYDTQDIAGIVARVCLAKAAKYGKPHFFGEFGDSSDNTYDKLDSQGYGLHDGLWASIFAHGAGTGMQWWWDTQVKPHDLYWHFKAVSNFTSGIDFANGNYLPLAATASSEPALRTFIFEGDTTFSCSSGPESVAFDASASPDFSKVGRYLQGIKNHPEYHNPLSISINHPTPVKFSVTVNKVSGYGGAKLKVELDGKLIIDKDFAEVENSKKTILKYNGEYSVEVPAGTHSIKVVNDGNDWLSASYKFETVSAVPPLHVFAMGNTSANDLAAFAWVKCKEDTWHARIVRKIDPQPVKNIALKLGGLPDGVYSIETWDTWLGKVKSTGSATTQNGILTLNIDEVNGDIAFKIRKQR